MSRIEGERPATALAQLPWRPADVAAQRPGEVRFVDARESQRSGTGGIVGRDEYRGFGRSYRSTAPQPVTGKEIIMAQMSPTTAAIGTP